MSNRKGAGDLEIHQNLDLQRRDWKAQRVGWALMLLLILASAVGLFGRGPLSATTAGSPGAPLRVEYDRFIRRQSAEQMTLLLAPDVRGGEARILLDSALLASIDIRRFTPAPEHEIATALGVVYTFRIDSAPVPRVIRIDYEATAYWSRRGAIALSTQPPLRLHFLVYP